MIIVLSLRIYFNREGFTGVQAEVCGTTHKLKFVVRLRHASKCDVEQSLRHRAEFVAGHAGKFHGKFEVGQVDGLADEILQFGGKVHEFLHGLLTRHPLADGSALVEEGFDAAAHHSKDDLQFGHGYDLLAEFVGFQAGLRDSGFGG